MPSALPASISIREVGPRDGLQGERPVAIADRLHLIGQLADAGLRSIEAAAFVSPRAVPAMIGAGQVIAGLPASADVVWWALVPNRKGAELALAAGVEHLTVTVSASEAYSQRNVRASIEESMAETLEIVGLGSAVDVVISCAFGSPYEGDVDPALVAGLARRCRGAGAQVTLADTTGMATPRGITEVIDACGLDVGLHLHDTRSTALVNAFAAMQLGIVRFDTSVAGLGGSPFAPGVPGGNGNLATEHLVYLCGDLGIATGVDLDRLLGASAFARDLVGRL
ncbi:MAG: hydroxymethylglutaryl-CoA lyase [Acidimicrobiales bacterium]